MLATMRSASFSRSSVIDSVNQDLGQKNHDSLSDARLLTFNVYQCAVSFRSNEVYFCAGKC